MPDVVQKEVQVILKYGTDAASAKSVAGDAKEVSAAVDKIKDTTEKAGFSLAKLAPMGAKLRFEGMKLGMISASILGPMTLAAGQYVSTVKMASTESRAWLDTQTRLSDATLRFGKVASTVLLPTMEKAASAAETLAAFTEANPEILKAAATSATILGTLGGALVTVGLVMSTVGKAAGILKTLGIGVEIGGAAAAAGGGAVAGGAAVTGGGVAAGGVAAGVSAAGIAAATLAGIPVGAMVYDYLAKTFNVGGGTRISQFATVAAYGIGSIVGKGNEWALAVGKATGAFDQAAEAAEKAAVATQKVIQAEADIQAEKGLGPYIAYTKQRTKAEQEYEDASTKIANDTGRNLTRLEVEYGAARAKALADYNLARTRALRDFGASEKRTEEEYNKERLKRAKQYGIDAMRAEEEHQKSMRRMGEDHQSRMEDAIANNDAKAAFEEMRSYERDRSRAEEDFQDSQKQQDAANVEELVSNEAQFKAERAQRISDFEQRFKDDKEDFDRAQTERADQYKTQKQAIIDAGKEQADALTASYGAQKTAQAEAFRLQLNDLGIYLGDEKALRDKYYADMLASFKNYMKGAVAGSQYGEQNAPVGKDRWYEPPIEGQYGPLVSGASGGSQVLHFAPVFNGMSAEDKAWYEKKAREQAEIVLIDFVRSAKRKQGP